MQTKLYSVEKPTSDSPQAYSYDLTSSHRWRLVGVKCDICGVSWACTGMSYPLVNLEGINDAEFPKNAPMTLKDFTSLRDKISKFVPAAYPILPGTHFGPSRGTARGKFGDFVRTAGSMSLLLRRKLYLRLTELGLILPPYAEVEIQFKGRQPDLDFVELHLPPTPGLLMVRATPPIAPCPSCGYQKVTWPHWPDGELEVSAASIPKHCDIFRMYDLTTCILCTQRFYDAVKELNASGLDFEEVGVV